MMTLRVLNFSCNIAFAGSAFALDKHTLITNRHVLAGALFFEVDTWNGTATNVTIDSAHTAKLVDIGIAKVTTTLPAVAKLGPAPQVGAPVTTVGYPLGGKLTFSRGVVLGYVDGRTLGPIAFNGKAIAISAKVYHGDSGGPLLDAEGRVVGVVYAGRFAPGASETSPSQVGYAIPLSAVHQLLRAGGTQDVAPCMTAIQ